MIHPNKRLANGLRKLMKDIGVGKDLLSHVSGVDAHRVHDAMTGEHGTTLAFFDKLLEPFGMRLEIVPYKVIPYRTQKSLVQLLKGEREPEDIVDHLFLREYKRKKTFRSRRACLQKFTHYDGRISKYPQNRNSPDCL